MTDLEDQDDMPKWAAILIIIIFVGILILTAIISLKEQS